MKRTLAISPGLALLLSYRLWPARMAAVDAGQRIGGPFELHDQQGSAVTQQRFESRWLLVFLGFSRWPISPYPEGDTPEVMAA